VRMIGDRAYGFRFSDLLYLAENGQEATELWLWKTGRKGLVWGRS
jgi:hypothetical protein